MYFYYLFIFSEISKQVLKQLVTLNVRAKENSEYLHILMLNINDIQEKINKMSNSNLSSACNIITDNNKQIAELFLKFPVSNQDKLNETADEIKNVDIEQLVSIMDYYSKYNIIYFYNCK